MGYQFIVDPKGASVTVSAATAEGANVQLYFDPKCLYAANSPVIDTKTSLYVVKPGTIWISLEVASEQWATQQNQPRAIDIREETGALTISPVGPYILGDFHSVS